MQLQFGKWMLYDHLVVRDFQSKLATYFRSTSPQLLMVRFQPASHEVLYIRRCLANFDINVALDLQGLRNGSFAYDLDCDGDEYTADGKCGVTGFDQDPCPPKRLAEFRLHPDEDQFTRFKLFDLGRRAVFGPPLDAGTLIIDSKPSPPQSGG
jgi:hypothetical protein